MDDPPRYQTVEARTHRKCAECGIVGGDDLFSRYKSQKGRLDIYCKPCRRLQCRKFNARWRSSDPTGLRKRNRRFALARFGLSPEDYETMVSMQGGLCACCGKPETDKMRGVLRALAIDHDHTCCSGDRSCGKCIRGLLCGKCNKAIGLADNSPSTLRKMAEYLEGD